MRALAPRTEAKYRRALERAWPEVSGRHIGAFGDFVHHLPQKAPKFEGLPENSRVMLRSAILRAFEEAGDEERGRKFAGMVTAAYSVKKQPKYPTLDEVAAFERCLKKSAKPGERIALLLCLKLGLRSVEVLNVRREDVQRALKSEELLVTVKGGREHILPSERVTELLQEALSLKARGSRHGGEQVRGEWQVLGQTISCGTYSTQHGLMTRAMKKCATSAGLDPKRWSPHKLRHGFASRLSSRGASIQVVQTALGHANIQTTQRYVHVEREQLRELMK